jgi:hypothetical protein
VIKKIPVRLILGGVRALQNPLGTGRVPTFASAYVGRKRRGDPDFLYAALDTTAYAAFFKESRMKFANATELSRKSGESPTNVLRSFHPPHRVKGVQ